MIHSSLDGIYRALEAKRSELLAKSESRFRNNEQYIKQGIQIFVQFILKLEKMWFFIRIAVPPSAVNGCFHQQFCGGGSKGE